MINHSSILLIEDDPLLGDALREILQMEGHTVDWVQNGRDAQQYLQIHIPALVLLDLHLPLVSGEQLLEEIQSQAQFASSKIVIISADLILLDQLQGKADAIMPKPIRLAQLTSLCADMLKS